MGELKTCLDFQLFSMAGLKRRRGAAFKHAYARSEAGRGFRQCHASILYFFTSAYAMHHAVGRGRPNTAIGSNLSIFPFADISVRPRSSPKPPSIRSLERTSNRRPFGLLLRVTPTAATYPEDSPPAVVFVPLCRTAYYPRCSAQSTAGRFSKPANQSSRPTGVRVRRTLRHARCEQLRYNASQP